jgi:hypothetical protein
MTSLSPEELTVLALALISLPTVVVSYFVMVLYLGKLVERRYTENGVMEMKFFQHFTLHTGSQTLTRAICSQHLFMLATLPGGWLKRQPRFLDLDDKNRILKLFSRGERVLNLATWTAGFGSTALAFVALGLKWYWQLPD